MAPDDQKADSLDDVGELTWRAMTPGQKHAIARRTAEKLVAASTSINPVHSAVKMIASTPGLTTPPQAKVLTVPKNAAGCFTKYDKIESDSLSEEEEEEEIIGYQAQFNSQVDHAFQDTQDSWGGDEYCDDV